MPDGPIEIPLDKLEYFGILDAAVSHRIEDLRKPAVGAATKGPAGRPDV